jgi:hypothetical protein
MATSGALPGYLAGVRVLDLTQFERLGARWAGLVSPHPC